MTTPVPNSTATPQPRIIPSEVGWQFVPQYYTFVNKQPGRLHCFYTKNSTFIHGTEGEDGKPCYGQHEIHSKILSIGFQDCKVFIHSVDAQSSANGGIIIQVIGEMSNKGEPWRKFAQTFFLAEQPNGYFVLNDIFRFLKEEEPADEEDEGEGEAVEHGEEYTPAPQSAEPAPLVTPEDAAIVPEPAPAVAAEASTHPNPAQQSRAEPPPAIEPTLAPPASNGVLTNGAHEESHATDASPVVEPAVAAAPAEETAAIEPEVQAPVEPSPSTPVHTAATPAHVAPAAQEPTPAAPPAQEKPVEKAPAAPAPTPAPPKPSAPKTWANLAAAKSTSWGANLAADSKGVSTAAAPAPSAPVAPKSRPSAPPVSQEHVNGNAHPAAAAAMSVTTAQCFVKSVTENVQPSILRDLLTSRFGPIKELEIVRSKACAFLEFNTVESARRAILASLPVSQGGEGGIWIAEGDTTGLIHNRDVPRITVETRKERGDRPPPRGPRGVAPPTGDGRGSYRGGAGAGGPSAGRGRGAPRVAAPAASK